MHGSVLGTAQGDGRSGRCGCRVLRRPLVRQCRPGLTTAVLPPEVIKMGSAGLGNFEKHQRWRGLPQPFCLCELDCGKWLFLPVNGRVPAVLRPRCVCVCVCHTRVTSYLSVRVCVPQLSSCVTQHAFHCVCRDTYGPNVTQLPTRKWHDMSGRMRSGC